MKEPENPSRREFTLTSAMAVLTGVTITITGCSDSSSSPSAPTASPLPPPSPVSGVIGANHDHVATITSAQLTAGTAISLNIQGASGHPHTVEMLANDLTVIRRGASVTKTSSTDLAHNHTVTFN